MQKVFTVYSDPGHAWAKVPHSVLYALGIQNQITSYSYQRGEFAYLEEDCDLSLFCKTFMDKYGIDPVFRESNSNKYSKIRGYAHYSKTYLTPTPFEGA